MKRLMLVFLMVSMLLCAAQAEGKIPDAVIERCERSYPGYAVLAGDGYDDGENGQWALVLTKDGHNVLLLAERRGGGDVQIAVDNPAALPREGEGYSSETHTIRVSLTKENRNDRLAFLEITVEQPDVSRWVITSALATDGVTWGNVISEYTTYDWDGRTVWWSHVFAEDGTINYMRHQEDANGSPLSTANYPRVPVSGESAAAHLLECFDASVYPYTPDGMNGPCIAEYAREYVPDGSALVQIDLQKEALILLTESAAGERTLRIMPHRNWQFDKTIVSHPLPGNASLDLFHAEEGTLQIEWGDGQRDYQFGFVQKSLNLWKASWLQIDAENYSANYRFAKDSIAVTEEQTEPMRNNGVYYGEHPWQTIETIDFGSIPAGRDAMLATLDDGGWAFVSNPNPEDRLHLRERPRKDARSFGKFYNRTPVRVHEIDGEWAYVSIGSLTGYMMTKYLAFGEDKDAVRCAFEQLFIREEIDSLPLQPWGKGSTQGHIDRESVFFVVGVDEERCIILTEDGEMGYVPESKFYPGNG
ncbi:MAG: SH3 domain-containing protein [Clostridia bacterium]|nr:SH3 domain-containing protein [Clostridia bacterium]